MVAATAAAGEVTIHTEGNVSDELRLQTVDSNSKHLAGKYQITTVIRGNKTKTS